MDRILFQSLPYFVARIFVTTIGMMGFTAYSAYRSGCVESMVLNGVCASDPKVDKWFK